MSYLWSGKITDYYYSNPESNTVAVLWTDPEDGLTREHYIKVDETDEQWRDFVKEVPPTRARTLPEQASMATSAAWGASLPFVRPLRVATAATPSRRACCPAA